MVSSGIRPSLPPSWDLWRDQMTRSARSDAGRATGVWALDVLESELGRGWLETAWEMERGPREILLAASHAVAFAEMVELALRLMLLHDVPGIARVRRVLQTDYRAVLWMHARIQLQVAALGKRLGWEIALEKKQPPDSRPTDVILWPPGRSLAAETFAVLLDEGARFARQYDDEVGRRIMGI